MSRTSRSTWTARLAGLMLAALALFWVAAAHGGEWLPGDMHSHISPPDVPPKYDHARNDLEGAVTAARTGGLKWLLITPHAMDQADAQSGRSWAEQLELRLAKRKAQPGDPLVVLGWERTYNWPGHLIVSFVDLKRVMGLPLEKLLGAVAEQRGLAIVAHPFQLPGPLDKGNRSWKPWTAGPKGQVLDPGLTGLKIRHPASPAASAGEWWDEWIGRERRRILGVGATDDHWGTLYPTTWVYIEGDLTREKLRDALLAGRIVVGSDASAGSLTVRALPATGGPAAPATEPPAPPGRVGDAITAAEGVEVNWTGKGRLYIDGTLNDSDQGPVTHKFDKGTFHWYRLEVGIKSYSNPIYVNLPAARQRKPLKPTGEWVPDKWQDATGADLGKD